MRQWSASSAPSNRPMTVWVFPVSIASSIGISPRSRVRRPERCRGRCRARRAVRERTDRDEVGAGRRVVADGLERDAARHLERHRDRRPRATASRTSSGSMLSSRIRSAPAATASCTWSSVSHSTSTIRPGQRDLRPFDRGREIQEREVVVLDQHGVAQALPVVEAATGAHRGLLDRAQPGQGLAGVADLGPALGGLHVPAGERRDPGACCRRFSAVRSAARIERRLPVTVAEHVVASIASPSAHGPAHARRSDRPGGTPRCAAACRRARRSPCDHERRGAERARRESSRCEVRSPSVPKSSASARATTRAPPRPADRNRRSCRSPGTSAGQRDELERAATCRRTGRRTLRRLRDSRAGCGCPGSPRAPRAAATSDARHREQVAQLVAGDVGRASTSTVDEARPTAPRLPASRKTPQPSVIVVLEFRARCDRLRHGRADPAVRGPTSSVARSAARPWVPAPSLPAAIASTMRGANTSPSSSEFEASRFAPCTPEHAASPHAHSPGKRGRAVEVGGDPAREVVRGRGHRQEVDLRVEPDRSAPTPRSSGTAGEVGDRRGVEPEVVEPALDEPSRDRAGDDVTRREVGQRMLVDHERDAVFVAQHRAVAAQRLGEQRPRHARMVQRGGVELHELDVGHRDAGAQRHPDAVAGGDRADSW